MHYDAIMIHFLINTFENKLSRPNEHVFLHPAFVTPLPGMNHRPLIRLSVGQFCEEQHNKTKKKRDAKEITKKMNPFVFGFGFRQEVLSCISALSNSASPSQHVSLCRILSK